LQDEIHSIINEALEVKEWKTDFKIFILFLLLASHHFLLY
jgi:hypothetical protein